MLNVTLSRGLLIKGGLGTGTYEQGMASFLFFFLAQFIHKAIESK